MDLSDLIYQCTVRISAAKGGTGFFVAPGKVLTCAHVVEKTPVAKVKVEWLTETLPFQRAARVCSVKSVKLASNEDLALLHLDDLGSHPCVRLGGDTRIFDTLFLFGYSALRRDQGDTVTVQHEGNPSRGNRFKMKMGQIYSGMSGSAVLDCASSQVCGVVTTSRDKFSDLGGGAITLDSIFTAFPDLGEDNKAFHVTDQRWDEATPIAPRDTPQAVHPRQKLLPSIQRRVVASLDTTRHSLILPGLQRQAIEDVTEWIESGTGGVLAAIGDVGMGKTHTLHEVANRFLKNEDYVVLFAQGDLLDSLNLEAEIPRQVGAPKEMTLTELLDQIALGHHRRPLLILDNLDYLGYLDPYDASKKVTNACNIAKASRGMVLLAYRPQLRELDEILDESVAIAPLARAEVFELLKQLDETEKALRTVRGNEILTELCRSPDYLRMLATLIREGHEVGDTELEVLEAVWRENVEGVRIPGLTPSGRRRLSKAKQELAEDIALRCFEKQGFLVKDSDIDLDSETIGKAYDDLLRNNILRVQGGKVGFAYTSFWEFCCARAILRDKNEARAAIKNSEHPICRGVVFQILLQAHGENPSLFLDLLGELKESSYLSKTVAIDLLLRVRSLSQDEKSALIDLLIEARGDSFLADYTLGQLIYSERPLVGRLFDVVKGWSESSTFEIKRRIAESLPRLYQIDHDRTIALMKVLREDWHEERFHDDIRRRVVESLYLLREDPQAAAELAQFRERDSVFTMMAITEFFADNPDQPEEAESSFQSSLASATAALPAPEIEAIEFSHALLQSILSDPGQGLDLAMSRKLDKNLFVRIALTRAMPRLYPVAPDAVMDLLNSELKLTDEDHRNLRRAVSFAFGGILATLRPEDPLPPGLGAIALALAGDPDDHNRLAVCDYLYTLLKFDPEIVRKMLDLLRTDDGSYIRKRCQAIAVRLIDYFPEERGKLIALVQNMSEL